MSKNVKTRINVNHHSIFFALILILGFVSCKKETDPIAGNKNPLLFRVLIAGEVFMEYTGTGSGFIYEEKSKFSYTKHTYNSAGLIEKSESYVDPGLFSSSMAIVLESEKRTEWVTPENTPKDVTNTYQYNTDGQLIRLNTERKTGYQSYSKYEYNNKGQISKMIFYNDDKPTGFISYSYDSRGNMNLKKHYYILSDGTASLATETEYAFDNYSNPYYSFRSLQRPGKETNPNNITKETYKLYFDVPGGTDKIQVTNYSYKYNSQNNPIQVNDDMTFEYE